MLTSIAGFSALLFSGLPGLAQLGLYSIIGLIVAAACHTLRAARAAARGVSHSRSVAARARASVALSRSPRDCAGSLLLSHSAAIAVLVAHRDTLWDPELSSLNPIPVEDRALDAQLRAALGAPDARLVVDGEAARAPMRHLPRPSA